jgi:hypothetical protein
VRLLRRLDRWPDIDAGASVRRLADADEKMLADEFAICCPFRDRMLGIFEDARAIPAG